MLAKKHSLYIISAVLSGTALFMTGCGKSARYKINPASDDQIRPTRLLVSEFVDEREFYRNPADLGGATPLSINVRYEFSRPDEAFTSGVEPFPTLFPKLVADDLEENDYFDSVVYADADETPAPGEYDLILQGTLKDSTSRGVAYTYGMVLPLGMSFYDLPWLLGMPKYSRRFDIAVDYQWLNGYTYEPVSDVITVDYTTSAKQFTQYPNESKLDDLRMKFREGTKTLIAKSDSVLPASNDRFWTDIRTNGEIYLAELARQQELIQKGSPPTFTVLSPVENAVIRNESVGFQWAVAAPNGMKNIQLTLNNQSVPMNINKNAMSNELTSPRSIPAQESRVALSLGNNIVNARIEDWRGNVTEEQYTITRYPAPVTPANRHALVIGLGTPSAQQTAQKISGVLGDPFVGQFPAGSVDTRTSFSSASEFKSAMSSFASKIIADEVALIYLAAPIDASSNTITLGSDTMSLSDIMNAARESIATDKTIIIFDLDWSSTSSTKIESLYPDMPQRWAVVSSMETPTRTSKQNGIFLYADTMIKTMKSAPDGDDRLTLERLFDVISIDVEIESNGEMEPTVEGLYDPNIIMVSYR